MGDKSGIEWTDATWNPVAGCSPVSEGCRNCYAARQALRMGSNPNEKVQAAYGGTAEMRGAGDARRAVFTGKVNTLPDRLDQPLRWKRPRRVFVNSMSDLFHESVPFEFIDRVFAVMALADRHTFQVLTKRPERMEEYFRHNPTGRMNKGTQERVAAAAMEIASARGENVHDAYWDLWLEWWPLPNIWLGTSVENQAAADERIPHLLRTPAAVRFLSCEPLLGPVELDFDWLQPPNPDPLPTDGRFRQPENGIHWVIVGGESGPGARPMHPDWVTDLYLKCADADVAFFFKQWGAWVTLMAEAFTKADPDGHAPMVAFWPDGRTSEEWPKEDDGYVCTAKRVGKKAAGCDLFGETIQELPKAAEVSP